MIIRRIPNQSYLVDIPVTGEVYVVIEETIGDSPFQHVTAFSAVSDGTLQVDLSDHSSYDRVLTVFVYNENGELLYEQPVEMVRPYVLPGSDVVGEELDDFWQRESIARSIIDSITGGFYRTRRVIKYESKGGDYLSLHKGIIRIHGAWQNGVKVYDRLYPDRSWRRFVISPDRTSIIIDGAKNRRGGDDVFPRWAPSDYLNYGYSTYVRYESYRAGDFPTGYDYLFDVEIGYHNVPSDIARATEMLMEDSQCMDGYFHRNIVEYDTDQYRIKYASGAFQGTGNRIADMILAKYTSVGGRFGAAVL